MTKESTHLYYGTEILLASRQSRTYARTTPANIQHVTLQHSLNSLRIIKIYWLIIHSRLEVAGADIARYNVPGPKKQP